MSDDKLPVLAIIGGTGALGTGLARRWLDAGYPVIIGSRSDEKALQAVDALRETLAERGTDSLELSGLENSRAAAAADISILTVPFEHQASTLTHIRAELQHKILVDATAPLVPPRVARVQLPPEGSAGQIAQALLGDEVQVVSAFQNVAADKLQSESDLDCDVLVCGDKKDARAAVIELVAAAGMRGLHAGSIANAAAAEALTSVIIAINKRYKCQASIKITGID